MVKIPKKNPIFENLNSYFVDIPKIVEHFQGEIGTGSLHFKSSSFEGVVFFVPDGILSGFYIGENDRFVYMDTLDRLLEEAEINNFLLSIYPMSPEKIYYWAQIPKAKRIYKDLSSEFTELTGLIRKMSAEKLSGYIDATIGDKDSGGVLFFKNGINLGGSYSWGKGELDPKKKSLVRLVEESRKSGGVFHVYKIDLERIVPSGSDLKQSSLEPGEDSDKPRDVERTVRMLEGLLNICERVVNNEKKIKENFSTLLKRKFVEKVDKYEFLDPFAAEFQYANRTVEYTGGAKSRELAVGVFECVSELAGELSIGQQLKAEAANWSEKYKKALAGFGLTL